MMTSHSFGRTLLGGLLCWLALGCSSGDMGAGTENGRGDSGGSANAALGGSAGTTAGSPGTTAGSGGVTPDAGSPAAGGAGGSGAVEGYPAGPYGQNNPGPGAVLENLTFRGYVNPTATGLATDQPLVDYSFAEFRLSGPRYALVHIGAVW
jgi:hypothetical protein